ncbi:MAG: TIGR00282 family metallophosphoesterase [Rhodobacteraceae bacterium]|nr:TIGR00282 family metallophosphoesterase [Paracoccaceae bacterium]
MKVLFLGDIVGRAGRQAVTKVVPNLRRERNLDLIVVNGENATNGAGLSGEHAKEILGSGVDCITLGDHAFDQKDMLSFIDKEPSVIRPLNFARNAPGRGIFIVADARGRKLLITQVLGQVFMKRPYSDPFSALDEVFQRHPLGGNIQGILVDIHCEATSEKMALGCFCNGRASAVIGTHTHIPTADAVLLSSGTAYQSDAGMCGDYDSVIGMEKAEPMRRFITGMNKGRFTPANGEATLCGLIFETDDKTGRAVSAEMVRIGGRLKSAP